MTTEMGLLWTDLAGVIALIVLLVAIMLVEWLRARIGRGGCYCGMLSSSKRAAGLHCAWCHEQGRCAC